MKQWLKESMKRILEWTVIVLLAALLLIVFMLLFSPMARAQAPLSISKGGTGATTIKGARDNLNISSTVDITAQLADSLANYLKLAGRPANQIVLGLNPGSIPLSVRGHATQSTSIFAVENSAGDDWLELSSVGITTLQGSSTAGRLALPGLQNNLLSVGTAASGGRLILGNTSTTFRFDLANSNNAQDVQFFATGSLPSLLKFDFQGQSRWRKTGGTASEPTTIVQRLSGQTSPLMEWRDETPTMLAQVTHTGRLYGQGLTLEDSTAGANTITVRAPASPTTHSLTLPGANASGTLVNDGAGVLSWAAGGVATGSSVYDPLLRVKDAEFFVKDDADTTKKFQFQASGITTGTTRTYTGPNANTTLAGLDLTQQFNGTQTFDQNAAAPAIDVRYNGNDLFGDVFQVYDNDLPGKVMWIDQSGQSFYGALFIKEPAWSGSYRITGVTPTVDRAITFPNASLTVVGTATTQTLTNKTLTSPTLTGAPNISGALITGSTFSGSMGGIIGLTNDEFDYVAGGNTYRVKLPPATNIYDDVLVLSGRLFNQTATVTVANTGAETTLLGSGTGGKTLRANWFESGRTIRITASGVYSTDAVLAGTLNIRIKKGSTVLAATGDIAQTVGHTNRVWRLDILISGRSSTTVIANGFYERSAAASGAALLADEMNNGTTTVTISSASEALDVTADYSVTDPDNSISCTSLVISVES